MTAQDPPARAATSMGRQLMTYVPANLVPALAAFLLVVIYTRLLSPAEFGRFNLAFSAVLIVQSVGFNGLVLATCRLYPANDGPAASRFRRTSYAAFRWMALAVSVLSLAAALVFLLATNPHDAVPPWVGLLLPLVLLRALIGQSQAINRAADAALRYNFVECAHAVLGLLAGVVLVLGRGPDTSNPILGLLLAAFLCAAVDWRRLRVGFGAAPSDAAGFAAVRRFALPLSAFYAATCLLQYGDRFLLNAFLGPAAVGPYAVAWSLVERPTTLLGVAVSLATFQSVVQTFEQRGAGSASLLLGRNGIALLALIVPACAGLALGAAPIAAVMVGPAFSHDVASLLPIMAVTTMLRCLSLYFIDHAFHLARRSGLILAVYLPAAAATLGLDVVLVPRLGGIGAAWSALGCQAAAVAAGILVGRRIFPLTLPLADLARVAAGTLAMAIVLTLLSVPPTPLGLLRMIAIGGSVYGAALIVVGLITPRTLMGVVRRGPGREVRVG